MFSLCLTCTELPSLTGFICQLKFEWSLTFVLYIGALNIGLCWSLEISRLHHLIICSSYFSPFDDWFFPPFPPSLFLLSSLKNKLFHRQSLDMTLPPAISFTIHLHSFSFSPILHLFPSPFLPCSPAAFPFPPTCVARSLVLIFSQCLEYSSLRCFRCRERIPRIDSRSNF